VASESVTIFPHEFQQKAGVVAIGLLFPHSLGFDFRGVPDPHLET